MVTTTDYEALRQASLKYLWMHNRDWVDMARGGRAAGDGRRQGRPRDGL